MTELWLNIKITYTVAGRTGIMNCEVTLFVCVYEGCSGPMSMFHLVKGPSPRSLCTAC